MREKKQRPLGKLSGNGALHGDKAVSGKSRKDDEIFIGGIIMKALVLH